MRKPFVRVLTICAVALVAALSVAGSPPAGAAATFGRYLYPLAGNSDYLVYSQSHAPSGSVSFHGCSKGYPTLHVRDKAGHTYRLPVAHDGSTYDPETNPCYGLSLTGDLLTFEGISGTRDPVYWWDLKRHTHGVQRLPENNNKIYYLGTVPGGWLFAPMDYSTKNFFTATTLYRQGTGGKVTTFADKLPRFFLGDVAISSRGVVTGNAAQPLRYLHYGSSTQKVLDVPAHKHGYNGCDAVTATYVVCHSISENSENGVYYDYQASITPLSGKNTITNRSAFDPKVGSMITGAIAAPGGIVALLAPTKTTSTVRMLGTDGRVRSAPGHGATTLTVAYGQIVVGHRGGRITVQTTPGGTQHTILH